MGLEIEFEYDDSPDGEWSPAQDARSAREWLSRGRSAISPSGNPLFLHLGIALVALAVGAASMGGFLTGRTAANNRAVALLHLAPADAFIIPALPDPSTQKQTPEQLLATPWTNATDQNMSLGVINDGPAPVTVLSATISSLDFDVTDLTPASTAPTAPGAISTLRGRAHFVCGDYPTDRIATVANLRVRSADGVIHHETLEVDRFSEIAEQSICALLPPPEVIRSTTFLPAPKVPASDTHSVADSLTTYLVKITASNRATFPLRMDLPQSAIESWAGGGLGLTTGDDVIIPPKGTGSITIAVSVTDCPNAVAAGSGYAYDLLAFSDGRDPPGDQQARSFEPILPIADQDAIMKYCLTKNTGPGGDQ